MAFYMLLPVRPKSIQAERKKGYVESIKKGAVDQGATLHTGRLFARVYYLHRKASTIDADNMSKPVLDALIGIVYRDDQQVVRRTAAKIDLNADPIFAVDTVPPELLDKLLTMISDEEVEHVLVVEVGELSRLEVKFGEEW